MTNGAREKKPRLIQSITLDGAKVRHQAKGLTDLLMLSGIDLGICTDFELEVFPKRMNIWLGEILDALV